MTQVYNYGGDSRAFPADGFFSRVRQALADYRLYRSTLEELEQLSDRDLRDLGMHRASLAEIAHKSVYGA